MKKIMIAAAAAAMIGGANAAEVPQAYTMKLTGKTSICAEGKAAKGYFTQMGLYEKGDAIVYRKQVSTTVYGLIWGCGCDKAFAGEWSDNTKTSDGTIISYNGLTFWNKDASSFIGHDANDIDDCIWGTVLNWDLLQRIGNTGDELEMTFTIQDRQYANNNSYFNVTCAGFGKVSTIAKLDENTQAMTDCYRSYIKSASGYFSGSIPTDIICKFCGDIACDVWEYCDCLAVQKDSTRAVFTGTWSLKYESSVSKKLQKKGLVSESYSFPKDLATRFALFERTALADQKNAPAFE